MRGPLSGEAVAALRAHPLLSKAVCAAAEPVVAIARNPPVIINDLAACRTHEINGRILK
jgi:hypothetical protein